MVIRRYLCLCQDGTRSRGCCYLRRGQVEWLVRPRLLFTFCWFPAVIFPVSDVRPVVLHCDVACSNSPKCRGMRLLDRVYGLPRWSYVSPLAPFSLKLLVPFLMLSWFKLWFSVSGVSLFSLAFPWCFSTLRCSCGLYLIQVGLCLCAGAFTVSGLLTIMLHVNFFWVGRQVTKCSNFVPFS